MLVNATRLVRSKDLLQAWTGRNIRSRYQQSIIGGLWIIVQPVATVTIFSLIFTLFVPIDTGDIPYPVFSYVAVVPWMLLANSLTDMTASLISNMQLIGKIYFPREILPLAAMLARVVDFTVAGALVFLLMLLFDVTISPLALLALPLVVVVQLMLIVGLGLIFAAANVFYRDITPLLTLGIQIWFYASPIIYPVSMVPERLQSVYFFNPMSGLLTAYRDLLLEGKLPGTYIVPSVVVSTALFLFGYWFFKRVEFQFADII